MRITRLARIGMFRLLSAACALLLLCMTSASAGPITSFTMLLSFDGNDGDGPYAGLVQASDGNLYGTTSEAGPNYGAGTIFRITPSGVITLLHTFHGPDGSSPGAVMIQAKDGDLYGTTQSGGSANKNCYFGCGVVFRMKLNGAFKVLHRFNVTDGEYPYGGLVQASDGNFYGTTQVGGYHGSGTIFRITPTGTLKTVHTFTGGDGTFPFDSLIQANDGNLYGTAYAGGTYTRGTIFRMSLDGTWKTLHSFNGNDGGYPRGGLVQATGGNLFGTTEYGEYTGGQYAGTVFEITKDGKLTTLHTFDGKDGANPCDTLVWATDGNLYGTTLNGGASGDGAVFEITPHGALTTIYSFEHTQAYPFAGLVQATNGVFYGTTYEGGSGGCGGFFCGMVFSISESVNPLGVNAR
jgi:uncharacterized repeat protein (TIGR03803 family)